MKTYKKIATLLTAIENCKKLDNMDWRERHEKALEKIMKNAPSGSGFDNGTQFIEFDGHTLKFKTAFHHLNENGFYTGWTDHVVTVKPSLLFDSEIVVSGKNKNDIKDYISEIFYNWLNGEDQG